MPLLTTLGAGSAKSFGFFADSVPPSLTWMGWMTGYTTAAGRGVGVDSSGNVYIGAAVSGNGFIAKFTRYGAFLWQYTISGMSAFNGFTTDSSGNCYVVGTSSGGLGLVMKINASGTLVWNRTVSASISFNSCAVDSSGNVYALGRISTRYPFVVKFSSAGVLGLQKQISLTTGTFTPGSISLDSSGNIYMTGGTDQFGPSGGTNGGAMKMSSAFARLYQTGYGTAVNDTYVASATTSAGDLYAVGLLGGVSIILQKLNSSGTAVWAVKRSVSTGFLRVYGVAIDSAGDVYVVGEITSVSGAYIMKVSSAGSVLWQRSITVSIAGTPIARSVTFTAEGNACVVVDTLGVVTLPADGSGTGTYVAGSQTFTYASATTTVNSDTVTSASTTSTFTTLAELTATPSITLTSDTPGWAVVPI